MTAEINTSPDLQMWRYRKIAFFTNALFLLIWVALVITDHLDMAPAFVSLRCWLVPPFLIHSTALVVLLIWQYQTASGISPNSKIGLTILSLTLVGVSISILFIGLLTTVIPPEISVGPSDTDGTEIAAPPSA